MRLTSSSTNVNDDKEDGDFSFSIDSEFEGMSLADILDELEKKT